MAEGITLEHGDARHVDPPEATTLIVLDPPWDEPDLFELGADLDVDRLVFTDARRFAAPIDVYGAPTFVFTWDTMNTWSPSPAMPVQQTKHALAYCKRYDRDGALWGDRPPVRDHPTTKQAPLDGRRLTDLWRESIRWLHNPTAGRPNGGHGHDRYDTTRRNHGKPLAWVACMIGNICATHTDPFVFDPFTGTGTTLVACQQLNIPALGVELDADTFAAAAHRIDMGEPHYRPMQQGLFDEVPA